MSQNIKLIKEVKDICKKCEGNRRCAFRSIDNDYCERIEDINSLVNNLYQDYIIDEEG